MQHDTTTGEVGKADSYTNEVAKYGFACEECEKAQIIRDQTRERVRRSRERAKLADGGGNGPGAAPVAPVTLGGYSTSGAVTSQLSGPRTDAQSNAGVTLASGPRSKSGNDLDLPRLVSEPAYADDLRTVLAEVLAEINADPKHVIADRTFTKDTAKAEVKDFDKLLSAYIAANPDTIVFDNDVWHEDEEVWKPVYRGLTAYSFSIRSVKYVDFVEEVMPESPATGITPMTNTVSRSDSVFTEEKTDSTQARGMAKQYFVMLQKNTALDRSWSTTAFDNPTGTMTALRKMIKTSGINYKVIDHEDGSFYIGF